MGSAGVIEMQIRLDDAARGACRLAHLCKRWKHPGWNRST